MTNTIKDLLGGDSLSNLVSSAVLEGAVYRMNLGVEEKIIPKAGDISRNKFFVVVGSDNEGNAFGFFVIDTKINENIPKVRQERHYKLESSKYSFLEGVDRYVDCSDFKKIDKLKFSNKFDASKHKGIIDADDLNKIKELAITYRNAKKKMLKRFGLIK